ncbi:hypothetical protein BASA60_003595 [Batrachochytrium salamandrivorans]|nr:hypothetical protein BASA60_003595 [Batrachochytrium salamandrivorans]
MYATVSPLTVVNPGAIVSKRTLKGKLPIRRLKLPNENPRDGFSKIVYPENLRSSPNGWTNGYILIGNNVEAVAEGYMTFETTTRGIFKGFLIPHHHQRPPQNLLAGAINAFYVANMVHDVLYHTASTEPAGNFQWDNFGRGGIDRDPVIINVQSSKEKNAASFNTFPDGQSGVLNLHIYTATKPNRDPALDNT